MRHISLSFGWLLLASAVLAQPAARDSRPSFDAGAAYSFSSDENLKHRGAAGSVAVHHYEFDVLARRPLSPTDSITYGLSFNHTDLDASAGTFLPDQLQSLALHVSGTRRLSDTWSATLTLRPGVYGDLSDINSKSFNVPLLAAASYSTSRDLVWLAGLRVDLNSEHPVLPLVGVRWRFAPDWSLNITYPRSGVQWRLNDSLVLDAGASLQGGTYRINDSLGIPPTLTTGRLANTFLDYREIRVGIGAEVMITPTLSLRGDIGRFVDREFDYFDRDYALDGEGGTFATLALRSRF